MAEDGRDWLFPGPRRDRMDQKQVIAALGLSGPRQLRRLIQEGRFPPAIKLFAKGPIFWRGSDIAAFLYMQGRGCSPGGGEGDVADEDPKE